jgi:hypothetical protein
MTRRHDIGRGMATDTADFPIADCLRDTHQGDASERVVPVEGATITGARRHLKAAGPSDCCAIQ